MYIAGQRYSHIGSHSRARSRQLFPGPARTEAHCQCKHCSRKCQNIKRNNNINLTSALPRHFFVARGVVSLGGSSVGKSENGKTFWLLLCIHANLAAQSRLGRCSCPDPRLCTPKVCGALYCVIAKVGKPLEELGKFHHFPGKPVPISFTFLPTHPTQFE